MADKKISQLTNLTGANLAENDEFVLVDTSADETKAITFGELKTAFDTGTGFVRVTGDTMTGNLTVPTVDINGGTIDGTVIGGTTPAAISGTTGTFSGNLTVDNNSADAVVSIQGGAAGSINGDAKLNFIGATSASGVAGFANIRVDVPSGGKSDLYIQTALSGGSLGQKNALKIDGNNDISFYEDTGTTPKFFWDASLERLGIGTTSPTCGLVRRGNGVDGTISAQGLAVSSWLNTTGSFIDPIISWNSTGSLRFSTSTDNALGGLTERMRIDSSGNVGIGTSSPAGKLDLGSSGDVILGQAADLKWMNTARDTTYGVIEGLAAGTVFKFGSTEHMRIDSSGNVGIGTSSPQSIGSFIPTLHLRGGSASRSGGVRFSTIDDSSTAFAYFVNNDFILGTSTSDPVLFRTNNTEAMRIDSSGNVGIGTSSPATLLHLNGGASAPEIRLQASSLTTNLAGFKLDATGSRVVTSSSSTFPLAFDVNGTERMRIDSSGNLLVGTTTTTLTTNDGIQLSSDGFLHASRDGNIAAQFNRITSDGDIVRFRKNGTTVGYIGTGNTGDLYIGNDDTGLMFAGGSDAILPTNGTTLRDNAIDLGLISFRFDDIYATNGTIQTSDRNEKQDIEALSDAEQRVAVACKGLLRKFRWKSSVEEKGDDARIHFGIIAQDLQDAFAAEGLDAGDYAMFISTTWTDEETGEERTRMGVRYSELLAFIIAAI